MGYNTMKEQHHKFIKQIDDQQVEIRKLRMQKKEMSMTYHKDLSAQKVQATMMLKS